MSRDSCAIIITYFVIIITLLSHNAVHYATLMPFADIVCSG